MRIGILGGTFDPIHLGHLYLVKKVFKKLSLKKVIFIPTYLQPHKKNIKTTKPIHRYNMVKLAIGKNKKFQVLDIEIKRKGRSYSIETLRELKKKYGQSSEIFFITGSDSLKDLNKWKNLKGILKLCKFVIVKRPGFALKSNLKDFLTLNINAKDVSATNVRKKIKNNKSINGLVSKKVKDYIKKNNLYV